MSELVQHVASVLARVERGETVEITNQDKPIARIVPIEDSWFDRMVAEGKIIPATRSGPIRMPTIPGNGSSASEALIAMREEERW
ncbi:MULTISPECIES: type II toxin-antitoxin system Phd/YefM family antitoxin [unclassified Crossiella]|uniref:type II toxin-antitoxin system Phd/YefM family antitoxin n=1 Tax=unclassified Crossiella TaxID=2620835 RepID=UPI001FFED6F4|nr:MULTISPECIES: type II toxin-antitoxin system prevent-host-death family antitoxin [unclassified Crossiella]MCK2242418.1 type II toxin-antitoxin system prevent-host-death family antitoxin [Crossiella sp. S99.2]MCK2254551.1 type II toxin-antitoxin system prevent-host-death family antitoxin [Crossiella sp. S99.1]